MTSSGEAKHVRLTKAQKPSDLEILAAMMAWNGGRRCVTYVMRNVLGRRCSTAWLRAQLIRMAKSGLVQQSAVQDRGGMINWEVTPSGLTALSNDEGN